MANPKPPPEGTTASAGPTTGQPQQPPHSAQHPAHHPGTTQHLGGGSQRDPLDQPDTEVNAEDLKNSLVADYLKAELPGMLLEQRGHVKAAPSDKVPPPAGKPREEVVKLVLDKISAGFLTTPDVLGEGLQELDDLVVLQRGLDPEAVRVSLPFNKGQVRAGGFALLSVAQSGIEDAKSMKVDVIELAKDLAQGERVRSLRAVTEPMHQIVDANESVAMNKIAGHIDRGLHRGWSVINANGDLKRRLAAALAVRGEPAATGVASRADNQRRDEAARADEQANMAAQGTGETQTPATTTITTQVPVSTPSLNSPMPSTQTKGTKGHKKPGK